MTMLIEIKPEVEAELSRQAAAQGVDVNAYAASLLEVAAKTPAASGKPSQPELPNARRSLKDVFESVRGLADDISFNRARRTPSSFISVAVDSYYASAGSDARRPDNR